MLLMNKLARQLLTILAGCLVPAAAVSADVIQTHDGRRIVGQARFTDGFVFVTSDQGPAKLKLEDIASLVRTGGDDSASADASQIVPRQGLLAEFFSDSDFNTRTYTTLLEAGASVDWGRSSPNTFTPKTYTARLSGFLTVPRSGRYRFTPHNFASVEIDGYRLGSDKQRDAAGLELDAGKPVRIQLEISKQNDSHFKASLHWSGDQVPGGPIPAEYFAPPEDYVQKLEQFELASLPQRSGGLKAEYFSDAEMRQRVMVRLDEWIKDHWAKPSEVSPALSETIAIRWTGQIKPPKSGKGAISVTGNGRIWLDGKKITDTWPNTEGDERIEKATVDWEAGRAYDLRVEFISGKGWTKVELNWNLEHNWSPPVPSGYLYPPADLPRASIILPIDKAEIDLTNGVPIHVVCYPGRGTIRKVEIIDKDGRKVLGEATAPPFHPVIRSDVAGPIEIRARVTNSQGMIATSPPVRLLITHAPKPMLGSQWSIGRVGDTTIPEVTEADGRITLVGSTGTFDQKQRLGLMSRLLGPDEQLTARLVELSIDDPNTIPLAGLVVRRSIHEESPHVMLLSSGPKGWYIASGLRERDSSYNEKPIALPVWLRLSRSGAMVNAYYSHDGEEWTPAGSALIGDDQPLLAGLTAVALNAKAKVTAVFDQIVVHTASTAMLATEPGVQLTNGSIIQGDVQVSSSDVSVRSKDGQRRQFPLSRVARIFYGPIHSRTADELTPGWRGVIVAGDLLQGEVSEITNDSAVVNSIIFGIRAVDRESGLTAVVLNDVQQDPRHATVQFATGRAVTNDLRLDGDKLVIKDPQLGILRLPITEIASIERPR